MADDNTPKNKESGCSEIVVGCGCGLVVLFFICKLVGWAWSIHWLFGLLVLLFIFGIK